MMSRIYHSLCLIVVGLLCLLPQAVWAQHYQPFADPCLFDYDMQWFKPLYCDCPDERPPNTGWYFTYDRLYWNVTRPEASTSHFDGDFTWGNRWDIGYMLDDDHGWLLSAIHVHGPTLDEINNGKLGGVELNKTFRLEPFHNGGILEPLLGVRFMTFWDSTDPVNSVENNIFGGQLGGRYFARRGRWLLSSELRFLFANNYQFLRGTDEQEFVPAGEVRLQAEFDVTEKVGVRVGWDLLYFGQGIARANPVVTGINDEDMLMTGVSFGVTLNR